MNVFSLEAAVAEIRSRLTAATGAAVATLNLDHVVKLRRNRAFRSAYDVHDLVTADGFPIVLAGRLRGVAVSRGAGSDLIVPLCKLAAELGTTVGLCGSTAGSLARASARLQTLCPGLDIVSTIAPPAGFDPLGIEADRTAALLRDSGARLIFLALGAPKQEIFAARARAIAPTACFVSVGAGLDFLSGHQTRAPRLVQIAKLEWAWRILGDPRRMVPRYLRCAAVLPSLLWSSAVRAE